MIEMYENDKKLIAASGLDPSTYKSGKYEGKSRISKRGKPTLTESHLAHGNQGYYQQQPLQGLFL